MSGYAWHVQAHTLIRSTIPMPCSPKSSSLVSAAAFLSVPQASLASDLQETCLDQSCCWFDQPSLSNCQGSSDISPSATSHHQNVPKKTAGFKKKTHLPPPVRECQQDLGWPGNCQTLAVGHFGQTSRIASRSAMVRWWSAKLQKEYHLPWLPTSSCQMQKHPRFPDGKCDGFLGLLSAKTTPVFWMENRPKLLWYRNFEWMFVVPRIASL